MKRRNFLINAMSGFSLISSKALAAKNFRNTREENLQSGTKRRRARELGIRIGTLETGLYNAITDVEGVRVGQTTIIEGNGKGAVRTGVTVILPNHDRIYEENLFASCFIQNGWGEMTGIVSLESTAKLKTPIFLTGTYNVGIVYHAALSYLMKVYPKGELLEEIPNPIVAECFDDFLSDTQRRFISKEDVFRAIEGAKSGAVEEGAVGGGTGMVCFDFKGGIGTSSRIVSAKRGNYVVGVLVMANTASRDQLRIDGVPVGKEIEGFKLEQGRTKSIILIAATDAPLLPFQLKKLAKRVVMGLAQTGAISSTGSGDIILAFSTGNKIPRRNSGSFLKIKAINDFWITPFYQATIEATQEAIINALTSAQTVVGRDDNTAYGIPLDQLKGIMKKYLRIGRE